MSSPRLMTLLLLLLAVVACATQPAPAAPAPPGFFHGLLHGFLAIFSLIGSLFFDIRVYAWPNSGFWYDCGFVIGAGAFFGGAASRR
jgi:hypothetical protein